MHITQKDAILGWDLEGKPYACLDLPSAKMAHMGETQSVFIVSQDSVCPLNSLQNLANMGPSSQWSKPKQWPISTLC